MTDGVVNLRPEAELEQFFEFLWADVSGYAYLPLKKLNTSGEEEWELHYFAWPGEKRKVIEHVIKRTADYEVYCSPSLYKSPGQSPTKENVLGTNVLWTEFDGNSPQPGVLGDQIPNPSMRVRSSNEGHEHLYWKLEEFETDIEKYENTNKAIAYKLQADTSGWDSTQILRPVNTKNHKRNKIVRLINYSATRYPYEFFAGLQPPPQLSRQDIEINEIPNLQFVIATHQWSAEDFHFFLKKEMPTGTRSSALMRLAFICAEMRMTDEEAFAILINADERWGKFKHRKDRVKRLLDLINRARQKYPIDPEVVIDEFPVYSWQQLVDLEVHVDWLIPGYLQRQGLMLISGAPGCGKTQFSMQMLIAMATGRPLLNMKISEPRKVIYFSMEMNPAELKIFQNLMNNGLTDEERKLLAENFMFVPIGHGVMFESTSDQKKIERLLETRQPENIVFDSLSTTTMDELSDERTAKRIMDYSRRIGQEYDTAVTFIHHNRKAQINNKKPTSLDDVYGSQFLTTALTTALGMWRNIKTDEIELHWLKVRLAETPKPMHLVRNKADLSFSVASPTALMELAENVRKEQDAAAESESPLKRFNQNRL